MPACFVIMAPLLACDLDECDSAESAEVAFQTLSTVQFASLVTAVTMLHDGDTCIVGIRGSNYLRLYSLSQLKASVMPPR